MNNQAEHRAKLNQQATNILFEAEFSDEVQR